MKYTWQRRGGFECSTKGDKRFSALNAMMWDGRTLECHYQCDVKGYQPGGEDWKLGKGKPPLKQNVDLWTEYLNLWRLWAMLNRPLVEELRKLVAEKNNVLSDCFASTDVNQAHTLSVILNETEVPEEYKVLNKHYAVIPDNAEFIGRPSIWKNLWTHLPNTTAPYLVKTRDEAVSSYEAALIRKFRTDPASMARLHVALSKRSLVCFCAPAKCHGDVLIWFANLPVEYCRLIYRLEIRR